MKTDKVRVGDIVKEVLSPTRNNKNPKCKTGVIETYRQGDVLTKARDLNRPKDGNKIIRILVAGKKSREILEWHDYMSEFWKVVKKTGTTS